LTSAQHDLVIRPVADRGELALFCRIPYEELDDDLDQGRRHLDWLWMALRGGELVAWAAWWTRRPADWRDQPQSRTGWPPSSASAASSRWNATG
jgi:hypothetical protein